MRQRRYLLRLVLFNLIYKSSSHFQVLDEVPVDEGALQAMTIAWRELQKPDKICQMYEGAVKKEPLNEDFLSHLFMSHVRMGAHKKQQLVAMNLYKAAHKNPYYFWSVMSLVMQALEGDAELGRTVHLPLALRMLQKMETDKKVEQEQEILLFCLVLEMKGDWAEAVNFLKGPLGQRLGEWKTAFPKINCQFLLSGLLLKLSLKSVLSHSESF